MQSSDSEFKGAVAELFYNYVLSWLQLGETVSTTFRYKVTDVRSRVVGCLLCTWSIPSCNGVFGERLLQHQDSYVFGCLELLQAEKGFVKLFPIPSLPWRTNVVNMSLSF